MTRSRFQERRWPNGEAALTLALYALEVSLEKLALEITRLVLDLVKGVVGSISFFTVRSW